MKIIVNKKNLISDGTWINFNKVRAIIENSNGEIAISSEGGKIIFPGGKIEKGEDLITAIKRELLEETGIEFKDEDLSQVLELETYYDDFYDYRTDSIKPRHTVTTYFYVKTDKPINLENLNLTDEEKNLNFKIKFVDKETLYKLLSIDHSSEQNGKFFDEENSIVIDSVSSLKK